MTAFMTCLSLGPMLVFVAALEAFAVGGLEDVDGALLVVALAAEVAFEVAAGTAKPKAGKKEKRTTIETEICMMTGIKNYKGIKCTKPLSKAVDELDRNEMKVIVISCKGTV
jgi:hypothetical protein